MIKNDKKDEKVGESGFRPESPAKEQVHIIDHNQKQFENMVKDGLINGGIHVNASKGHGKTRLLFSIAEYLQTLTDCRVLIFDGSESWLYGYSKISVFEIHECDISTVQTKSIDEIEKYSFNNWQLVKKALDNHRPII
jgi:predicted ATP-dependent serine protease